MAAVAIARNPRGTRRNVAVSIRQIAAGRVRRGLYRAVGRGRFERELSAGGKSRGGQRAPIRCSEQTDARALWDAEVVRRTRGTAPASRPGSARLRPRALERVEQRADEEGEHLAAQRRVARQCPAEPDGKRKRPLSVGRAGKHVVHQVCGDIAGAPGAAGGTHPAPLTGERDQQLVAASGAADAGEPVREHAAAEVLLQLAHHERGEPTPRRGLAQEVRERAADGDVKGRLLGSSRTVRGRQRLARRAIPSLVHVPCARTRTCPPSRHSPPTEGPRCRPPAGLLRGRGPIPADRWTHVRNRAEAPRFSAQALPAGLVFPAIARARDCRPGPSGAQLLQRLGERRRFVRRWGADARVLLCHGDPAVGPHQPADTPGRRLLKVWPRLSSPRTTGACARCLRLSHARDSR